MQLELNEKTLVHLKSPKGKKDAETLGYLDRGLSFHRYLDVDFSDLKKVEKSRDLLKSLEDTSSRTITKYLNTLKKIDVQRVHDLQMFLNVLKTFLLENAEDSTVFYRGRRSSLAPQPYLVTGVKYVAAYNRSSPYVSLDLSSCSIKGVCNESLIFHREDLGKTIVDILEDSGIVLATEEMLETHNKYLKKLARLYFETGTQYWCRGDALPTKNTLYITSKEDERYSFWSIPEKKRMTIEGSPTRCVIDTDVLETVTPVEKAPKAISLSEKEQLVPFHVFMHILSLTDNSYYWIHVADLKKYEYDKELGSKLVLGKTHVKLIDSLVKSMHVLQDATKGFGKSRIIRNKAKSCILLCIGPPGTGKTLTAEAYSETIERPLCVVPGGELVSPSDKDDLSVIFGRLFSECKRLNMPVLVDEADTLIQERDGSLERSAIVSSVLRALEYSAGLLWLTTNTKRIDDAVLSRCLAVVEYKVPLDRVTLSRLWATMADEFEIELSDADVKSLVTKFPNIVGRDIQNLIRLATRMSMSENSQPTIEKIVECSVFRGLTAVQGETK